MKKSVILQICAIIMTALVTAQTIPDSVVIATGVGVNLRSGAGTHYEAVGKTEYYGEMFEYISSKTDSDGTVWYEIARTSERMWISSKFAERLEVGSENCAECVTALAKDSGCAAVQAVYFRDGGIVGSWCFGDGITQDTKIRVASLSKILVAMEAMSMHERGIADIGADVSDYLGVSTPGTVTLRDLLTHTSPLASVDCPPTWEATLELLSKSDSWTASGWYYNNFAVGIAGSALEAHSGTTLENYARTVFFEPLGINASWYSGSFSESELCDLTYSDGTPARSRQEQAAMAPKTRPCESTAYFAGSLTVSARDFAKLVSVLACDGTVGGVQYLYPESVAEIERAEVTAHEAGGSFSQCMPLRKKDGLFGRERIYYHTGNAYGVLALASYDPETRDGVVVLTVGALQYRDSQGIYAVCSAIARYLYLANSRLPEVSGANTSGTDAADTIVAENFSKCA